MESKSGGHHCEGEQTVLRPSLWSTTTPVVKCFFTFRLKNLRSRISHTYAGSEFQILTGRYRKKEPIHIVLERMPTLTTVTSKVSRVFL